MVTHLISLKQRRENIFQTGKKGEKEVIKIINLFTKSVHSSSEKYRFVCLICSKVILFHDTVYIIYIRDMFPLC